MTPDDRCSSCFDETAAAVRDAVAAHRRATRVRDRTERPGQYALDLVADDAALRGAATKRRCAIVSEESGVHGRDDAPITVVLDPVDGSTNCARGIAYWATSIVRARRRRRARARSSRTRRPGTRTTAVRGEGAFRDGVPLARVADDAHRGRA